MNTRNIGAMGEEAAARYLVRKGYVIRERNFRINTGEIDIIAVDNDGCTVFVEVKTRKNDDYGYPSQSVDKRKQEKLIQTASTYCGNSIYMRFDVIEVYYRQTGSTLRITNINHIENAF